MRRFKRYVFGCFIFWLAASASAYRVVRLTSDPGMESAPAWSPDGKTISFQSDQGDDYDLCTIPAAGGAVTKLTDLSGLEGQPSYSPDGRYIVFTGLFAGVHGADEDIYIMPAAGGAYEGFSNMPGYDALPDWSRDGAAIAYSSERGSTGPNKIEDIWVQPYPTGEPRRLTFNGDLPAQCPAWSPDSKNIAFNAWVTPSTYDVDIFVVPAAGGTPVNITNTPGVQEFHPTWTADGKYIVFDRNLPENRDLYIIPAGGGEATRLTEDPAIDYAAVCSPVDNRVAFASNRNGSFDIYILYVDDTSPENR